MRLQPSTIVFAGAAARDMPMLERAGADAIMLSWEKLRGDKKLQARIREGLSPTWKPILYLDSGVFTIMRRAGVAHQPSETGKSYQTTPWTTFKDFAKSYIDYLRQDAEGWDWIIEMDVDDVYGTKIADAFRKQLKQIVGKRLLPVWHAQRGPDGWDEMIREFSYVAISVGKATGGAKTTRNQAMIREMVRKAHANGVYVHVLGLSSPEHFEALGADTMDASSWAAGVRWGELKVNRGKVMLPKFETRHRRALVHSHLAQVRDLLLEWGFTLEQVRNDYLIRIEVGIRLLLMRQEYIREQRSAREVVS